MLRRPVLLALGGLWVALLVPTVPLSQHDCHGLIGVAAHSPLYAFVGLTAFLAVAASVRTLRRPPG